jgi:hypothetical protein
VFTAARASRPTAGSRSDIFPPRRRYTHFVQLLLTENREGGALYYARRWSDVSKVVTKLDLWWRQAE